MSLATAALPLLWTGTSPSSASPEVSLSTVQNPGLGICLFSAWADFPGLRPQLSLPSWSLVMPSFHPIFPGCSCQCQLPRGFCPCPPLLHGFGDSAWGPGQSRVPVAPPWEDQLRRGERGGGHRPKSWDGATAGEEGRREKLIKKQF